MPSLGDRDEVLQLTEEHPHLLGLGTDSADNARPRGLPIRTRGAAGLSRNCLLGPGSMVTRMSCVDRTISGGWTGVSRVRLPIRCGRDHADAHRGISHSDRQVVPPPELIPGVASTSPANGAVVGWCTRWW